MSQMKNKKKQKKNRLPSKGWLEPLLDRIARNSTTVVCPVIDVIDEDSLAIHFDKKSVQVGGFDWGLQVKSEREIGICFLPN